jgi:hypothetical protein
VRGEWGGERQTEKEGGREGEVKQRTFVQPEEPFVPDDRREGVDDAVVVSLLVDSQSCLHQFDGITSSASNGSS